MSFFKRRKPAPACTPLPEAAPAKTYHSELMKCRSMLARERMSRNLLIKFLDTNCVRTEHPDGTVTFAITSFVQDLKHLLVEEGSAL